MTLAAELGPRGIRVNAIAPGTTFTEEIRANIGGEQFAAISASTPLQRVCEPDELARLTVFLASDLSRCITGQLILADAGAHLGSPAAQGPGRPHGDCGQRGGACVSGTGDFTGDSIIDTHVHVVSDDTARYPRQINASATHSWWAGVDCDTAALRRTMDAHGIATALAVQAVGVYAYDNAYLLDEVASGSGRVVGVVAVDADANGAAEEIEQLSLATGVVGIRLFAVSPGSSWVHSTKADEAFDAASRSGLPVVLTAFDHQLPPLAPSIARLPHAADRSGPLRLPEARWGTGPPGEPSSLS